MKTMDGGVALISDRTVLARAAKILGSFSGTRRVLSLTELTARSSLPKSTTHRLAGRLVALGWLERETDGYRIGMRLFETGRLSDRRIRLRETVFPYLQELAVQTQQAGMLAILAHEEAVCIDHVSGPNFRLPVHNGVSLSATRTAVGKALLAHQPAEVVERIVAAERAAARDDGPDLAELMTELAVVRTTGVAVVEGTAYPDITCVATPLCAEGAVIGAIALSGPSGHIKIESAARGIRAASHGICADYIAHMERAVTLRH